MESFWQLVSFVKKIEVFELKHTHAENKNGSSKMKHYLFHNFAQIYSMTE